MTIEIGLSGFIRFANATARARPRLARQIAEQSKGEYQPGSDFWRPMRNAIRHDRKTTRDGAAVRAVVDTAPLLRRTNYREVSERWLDISERWQHSSSAQTSTTRLEVGGIMVRLAPLFAEQTSGQTEAAFMWFNKEELKPETADAIQLLLARLNDTGSPTPTFVDLRRNRVVPINLGLASANDQLDEIGAEYRRLGRV